MRKLLTLTAALLSLCAGAATADETDGSGQYYRLFMPLTFYHSVAGNQLSLDAPQNDVERAVERALLNVYLTRPDLVTGTESEMEESGTLRNDLEKPLVQKVELTDDSAPLPDEPEAEPTQVLVTKPNFWKFKGDGYLQFMQNYVSGNWYKGGESNYSAVGSLTLEADYDNQQRWKWENKLEMKLGMQRTRTDQMHKFKSNEDLLRYTGKIGLQASNRWYYTIQLLAYTQFTHGYKANDAHIYSDFMSPFNLNLGFGMDYKVEAMNKKLTGTVNLSPVAINYRYVGRSWFEPDAWFPTRYGIDAGKHHLLDVGSQVTASLEWKLNDVVTWKSRFYAFTSYHRAEVEWENTFALRVSKYISANLFLFPRYDDSGTYDRDLGYFQFKEYSSLGFSYNF